MRNMMLWVVGLLLVAYVSVKVSNMYKDKMDLTTRVEHHLDFVAETPIDTVKKDIIHDARKFGIELHPSNVTILCEDTEVQSVAQQIVGSRLGAQFVNKRVAISVHYQANILGIPLDQDITRSKIKQVQASAPPARREVQELMAPTP
jgi:hypothetical protein